MNSACISKLIIPGSLVSFRKLNQTPWSLNIITECTEDTLCLPFTNDLLRACLFSGTQVDIKFNNQYYEYILNCSVVKIELSRFPYILVKVDKICESPNNRLFPRLDVYLPAALSTSSSSYYCNVSNLSLGGTAFLIDQVFPENTSCEINILLEDNSSIYAKGQIVTASTENELYKYCMMFTFMEEENSNRLFSYLDALENSYASLKSKYLNNTKSINPG